MSAVRVPLSAEASRVAWLPEAECARLGLARPGDAVAFEEIVQQHQTRLYHLAYRMLRHREEAEDVVQEAFVKAFEALPSLRATGAFPAWLGRIAVTLCLSRLRSARRRREFPTDGFALCRAEDPFSEDREYARLVREVLAQLPPQHRSLLEARYLKGYSYTELADSAGIEIHTLKTRLFRARRCLRARLGEALGEPLVAS